MVKPNPIDRLLDEDRQLLYDTFDGMKTYDILDWLFAWFTEEQLQELLTSIREATQQEA